MSRVLKLARDSRKLEVSVCVTGMHLLPQYGETVREIEADGLRICSRIPVHLDGSSGAVMVHAIAAELAGLVDAFKQEQPDVVAVLGDRGEMIAGALAAIHLNIPVVHVHGGERSGTVDEPVRHAISKLAHYHFVSTEGARERLVRMGERSEHVFVTGAPGLDDLCKCPRRTRLELCREWGFDPNRPVALVVFHAVLQEAAEAGIQMEHIMQAIIEAKVQALCLEPNSDAGGRLIHEVLNRYANHPDVRRARHLMRADYSSWMAVVDVMIGNSSSGIIEAATFNLPVVNVGNRQRARERSGNVTDVLPQADSIRMALTQIFAAPRGSWKNVYGDGRAGERIVQLLETLPISTELLFKTNVY